MGGRAGCLPWVPVTLRVTGLACACALGLVTSSSPGMGDVLKREPNLGGLHQQRSIPNKIIKQTGGKKKPYKATRITNEKNSNVKLTTNLYQQ